MPTRNQMSWMANVNALIKAAAIPVCVCAGATIAMAGRQQNPGWHSALFVEGDPMWHVLMFLAYGGLGVGTIAGWLLLREWVQTKTALILLSPYLALIVGGICRGTA